MTDQMPPRQSKAIVSGNQHSLFKFKPSVSFHAHMLVAAIRPVGLCQACVQPSIGNEPSIQ